MTCKERLHKLVDELSEAEAEETLRFAVARHEGRNVDEWGDLDETTDKTTALVIRDLRRGTRRRLYSVAPMSPTRC